MFLSLDFGPGSDDSLALSLSTYANRQARRVRFPFFVFGFRPRKSNPARLTISISTNRLGQTVIWSDVSLAQSLSTYSNRQVRRVGPGPKSKDKDIFRFHLCTCLWRQISQALGAYRCVWASSLSRAWALPLNVDKSCLLRASCVLTRSFHPQFWNGIVTSVLYLTRFDFQ